MCNADFLGLPKNSMLDQKIASKQAFTGCEKPQCWTRKSRQGKPSQAAKNLNVGPGNRVKASLHRLRKNSMLDQEIA
jgi:hypothetical protein